MADRKEGDDDARRQRRRARWRRNKRAERSRNAKPLAALSDKRVEAEIWKECAARKERYPQYFSNVYDWRNGRGRGSFEFQCDVWAVRTLLEHTYDDRRSISDGKIARWMIQNDLSHGYKEGSLRTMVWRARQAIAIMETTPLFGASEPFWPPFDGVCVD